MAAPHLYRQLIVQLGQWIDVCDQRHLQVFSELVSAILLSQSACASHWLAFMSHRNCAARSHLERVKYFLSNPRIKTDTFYTPLVKQFLQAWEGESLLLAMDTSMLWDEYCLIEVSLIWGGRSIALGQRVLKHGSASVGFEDYRCVLEATQRMLPANGSVTLLADRGFEHGNLMRWLNRAEWNWIIRAKSDLNVTLASGREAAVCELLPLPEMAHLYHDVRVLNNIDAHLATANLAVAQEPWAVLTNLAPSLQIFEMYGKRFGGIEPHFKDYKSAGFDLNRSHLRDAQALTCLFMLLAAAGIIAMSIAIVLNASGFSRSIDSHSQRGLSFLQLGLRFIQQFLYLGQALPAILQPLPTHSPPPAAASRKKRAELDDRIIFSRFVRFSAPHA